MCIAGYPTNCPTSDRDDCEDLYHSLRYSYNQHIDDCDEIMSLELVDMSHVSIFNDFDDTDDDCHGRIIIDKFTMITVDSAPADNHKCTLGTGTNDLGNDTRAHTTSYSGQVEGACGLFGNSTETGNIAANISGSNCDHMYSVEDELLSNCDHKSSVEDELLPNCDTKESVEDETNSNCDTKEKVEDETNSNCDTSLVEDESIRMGENSNQLDVISHDLTCQPLGLEKEYCDIDAVQDSLLEDMVSCSLSDKPPEYQKIWSILSDKLSYVVENMPTCMTYTPPQGYHFKKWKAKQALYDAAKCNTPCKDHDDRYYGIQHDLKNDFEPHVDISATYLWSQDDAKTQATKTWFDMGIFPVDGRASTYGYLVDKTPCFTLFDTGASKATFEIIAYLLPFSTAFDFIFGLKTMTEIEGKSNFSKLEFKFKKRSIDITPLKDIHLPVGQTTAIDCEMVKKPPDLSDGLVVVKMKSQREDCLPQTLRVAVMNGKIHMNVKNTGQGDLHLLRGQNIGIVDLRSAGYYHITRDGIQRCLHERFIFLNERDSQDYLSLTHTISDITGEEPHKNTRLDVRKASTNRTVKTKYKDDANKDPYPWLDHNDPRRNMTDKEILESTIDLPEACITEKQKQALYKILLKYREAFSLRDEIGLCPNMEVKLELKDKTPFYIRPFPIKEEEKIIVDKEMRKGCLLGILRKGLSSYSSPIMLIPRKMSGIPRIITDFRHLNSRLVRLNCSFPLVRDAIQILGASECELISVIDLRDAYHTLRLSTESQKYCGITPYYG